MLTERDEERGRLTRFFTGESDDGRGRIGVISGAVGSGKTALLNNVSEHVAASGARLLSAVASPREQDFPYAVLEQLLQGLPPLADGLPPLLLPTAVPDPHPAHPDGRSAEPHVPLAILRGFHRTLVGLTEDQPMMVAIDDVQFADAQSLACLAYAARRLPSSALSLLVARGAWSGSLPPAVKELLHQLRVCNVRLGPLSEEGVDRLLTEALGATEAARLTPAFYAATGGNPLLVQGFLDDAPRGVRSTAADRFAPRTGEMFRQAALACVHRSGRESLLVAQGVAVLETVEPVALLSALTGLEERIVRQSIDALAEAGVLAGPGFRYEAVHSAVLEDLPGATVAQLRWRAARLLHQDGACPTVIARQLVGHEVPAPHEEWVPRVLRAAAHQALADDEVPFATRCLQTAERCCPDEQERLAIRAELAQIIWRVKPSASVQQLQALAEPARAGLLPPAQTLRLAVGMMWNGQMDDAAAAIRQVNEVMAKKSDPRLDTELHAVRLMMASTYPDTLVQVKDSLEPLGDDERWSAAAAGTPPLKALGALQASLSEDTDDVSAAQAEQVLHSTHLSDMTLYQIRAALLALVYAEQLGPATVWCDRFLREAENRGAPGWLSTFNALRALIAIRRGNLVKAVECAELALEQLPAHGWGVGIGMPLSILVKARTSMGHHEAAAELLESPVPEAMFATRYGMHYLYARGRHQLATGRHHAALTDFLTCGERMRAWDMDSASLVPWRLGAAETWLAMDSHDDNHAKAAELAKAQLARATDQQARIRGAALRVLAATRQPVDRPGLLVRAVTALQEGSDAYEMARALADLGQAHKQLGDVTKGRLLIRRAWRMADGCGAEELYRSLQPAPVRGASAEGPGEAGGAGRADTAAVASLTEAERRVASLAVYGYTNREIAAKLFITISTVEQHLTRVYRKINISHRQDLPVSLDSDVAHSA